MEVSVTKRIAKNLSWLTAGEVLSRGIGFLTIIYIARVLGAAAFGLLNFAQAFLAYLLLIVDSGLSILGTREIAREHARAGTISLNIFALRLLIATLIFLIACVVLWFFPITIELKLFFGATFLFVFYRALNADWSFQGLEKMEYIALSKILFSVIVLAATVFMVSNIGDLIKVPLIQFAGGLLVSLVFIFVLFRCFAPANFGHFAPAQWWDYFSEAIPLGASFILVQIYYNLDTIMLGFMSTAEEVGLYNAAYKLFFASVFMLGIWQSTAFPVVTKRLTESRQSTEVFLNKYIRLTFLFCVPAAFLVTIISPVLVRLFYGSAYLNSTIALQILAWNIIPLVLSGVYGSLVLIPLGRTRDVLSGAGAGAIINVILNFMLIPKFGFVGAAAATLMTELAVAIVIFLFAYRKLPLKITESFVKPLLASIIVFFLALAFAQAIQLQGFGRSYVSGAVFVLGYAFFIVFSRERIFLMNFAREVLSWEK